MKGYNTQDVTTPSDGKVVIANKFWLCRDGDPKKAIFFGETPQCNSHQEIPYRMLDYTESKTGWDVEIVHIDLAYRSPER